MRIGVVIASRSNSRRLNNKATLPICKMPMLELLIRRSTSSRLACITILATSVSDTDNHLSELGKSLGIEIFRGSLDDVLDRYTNAAEVFGLDVVVRLTGDNPFIDGQYIDYCLSQFLLEPTSIWTSRPKCPDGLNVEIIPSSALIWLNQSQTITSYDREHVTSFFYTNKTNWKIKQLELPFKERKGDLSLTIDTIEEYHQACQIVELVGANAATSSVISFIEAAKALES